MRIEDYGLIGDCETAALVSRDGSIDWLCWPRFDSNACFAALLGGPDNGRWRLAPVDPNARATRRYRPDTLILETEFSTPEGRILVIDFMPLREESSDGECSDVIRLVRGLSGSVAVRMELTVRFDYGSAVPWVMRTAGGDLTAVAGPDMLVLRTPVETRGEGLSTVADFTVAAGETVPFILLYHPSHKTVPLPLDPEQALVRTQKFWEGWARQHTGQGEYASAVGRSLITLKALTYAPTGGIVAAPTTSLPERIGGSRNWDYRFCWLRDATLTLLALMNAGHYDEARAWRDWLMRAAAGSPSQLRIMYGLGGERRLVEWEAEWLPGYESSRPVRIGNAAAGQLQLDVFGEVADALHQARLGGLQHMAEGWDFQRALLANLETVWEQPDEGIWEDRGGRRQFTHSKVMAWVAFDRAIKSAEAFGLEGDVERWRRVRAAIHGQVCARAFNPRLNAFSRDYGSENLDASTLLMASVGFLPPEDARIKGTIAAIERHLLRDGFVLRYDTAQAQDGLAPGEGAFLACSFWLADAYIMAGRRDEACHLFDRLLALRNDLGLLAEEYDPGAGRLVGNFPQAFSHVALINTAHNLYRPEKPTEQRSGRATGETQAAT